MQLIINHVTEKNIADIGTDHAYIPIELMKNKVCDKVIASDIKQGPAKIALKHIRANNVDVEVRIGPGLTILKKGEVEQIIIAGMGGKMIETILFNSPEISKNTKLLLQPMNAQYELRKYLIENKFGLCNEDIITEGYKVYNLFEVSPNIEQLNYQTESDYHLPSFLKEHKFYNALKEKKIREITKIITGNEKSSNSSNEKLSYYKAILKSLS